MACAFFTIFAHLFLPLSATPPAWAQQGKDKEAQKEEGDLADRMPGGEGKDTAVLACGSCHGLALILASRKDARSWTRTVDDMVSRGVPLLPDESDTLVKYLAAHFGPLININQAGVSELASLPSMDDKLAEAIVRHRKKHGPFEKIEDLAKVQGLSADTLRKLKDRLTVGSKKDGKDKE